MPNSFKGRHFPAEFILLCVRWYLKYNISCRQLAEMMEERGFDIHFTTIYSLDPDLCAAAREADPLVPGIHDFLFGAPMRSPSASLLLNSRSCFGRGESEPLFRIVRRRFN